MAHSTFKGGIHPHKRKRFTREKPIREYYPKGELVYPVSQHIGGPAVPIVKPGDRVLKGQVIAKAAGYISVPIHASVSGTVTAIEPRMTVSGNPVLSIIVENDNRYERMPIENFRPWQELEPGDRILQIQKAGIVGMGGAGFPTHVKLAVKNPKKIRTVIVNCSECEPYLTSDYRRMVENPEWLVMGLKMILSLFDRAVGIFAIEDSKRDAITALQLASGKESRMEVRVLETKYPEGAERMLVYACTGKEINSSMLPADAGCIVHNVDTVCAIYQALAFGRPLTERVVTVTGKALANPRNFNVPIGTSFAELIDAAGGFSVEPKKFVAGGPMMGISLFDLDVPVVKTSSALLCMTKDDVARFRPSACIRCGSCVEACPEGLLPAKLADLAEHFQEEEFRKLYGMECLECGSCSFVCPARRHLTQSIRAMRRSLLAKGKR
ncbi:MAG: electron transport complex subunit RsxC [Lachnospiraceae bacterium]|jgi:electron transport complex protein RnfC|nr:electron transport complex subunit RsxC [Lachnospiraceae bacterium]